MAEEIFCLNYEMKLFSEYVSYGKLERWIPGFSDTITEESHITRYEFISKFIKNKEVLDIACGTGKGSYMIAETGANNVTGVDIDADSIRYATHRFKRPNLSYNTGNALFYNCNKLFDVIISFETIEHLPEIDAFLQMVNNHLKDTGTFFVSTPISAYEIDLKPKNVYHIQEWGLYKFQEIITKQFDIEHSYLQLFPERPEDRFTIYWNRIFNRTPALPYTSKIYGLDEVKKAGKISKLGNAIKGFQILQCRKRMK